MIKSNLFNYAGGKITMLKHILPIIESIPHTCFVDAFGGSASVLLNKKPSKSEVLNDINSNIYTLYKVLRDPILSEQLFERLDFTLHSLEDFNHAKDVCDGNCAADDVERARCTFIKYTCSFGGIGGHFARARLENKAKCNMGCRISKMPIFQERLKHVTLENEGYEKLFERYDSNETLFFLDHPYVKETRTCKIYDNEFTTSDHENLIKIVNECKGAIILCTFDNSLYDTGLKGFEKVVVERTLDIDRCSKNPPRKINEAIFVKRKSNIEANGSYVSNDII